eukprot:TRINITY_DN1330_c1_g3_i5.p1 TRINITY_DN1330_c1_g3~~TRINITY_DN1330_c1_g3_i5.p1  ORF type:complete len:1283 (-),score=302.53 TRINITY_DN1330_c1_g3_i5:338-4159(-)
MHVMVLLLVDAREPEMLKSTEKKAKKNVHENIICDGCRMFPLVGVRYHCLYCEDFDLCGKCHKSSLKTCENAMKLDRTGVLPVPPLHAYDHPMAPVPFTRTLTENYFYMPPEDAFPADFIRMALDTFKEFPLMGWNRIAAATSSLFRAWESDIPDAMFLRHHPSSIRMYLWLNGGMLSKMSTFLAKVLKKIQIGGVQGSVAILSENCVEWTIVDFACALQKITSIPVSHASDHDTLSYVLNRAHVSVIAVSKSTLLKYGELISKCEGLRVILGFCSHEEMKSIWKPFESQRENILLISLSEAISPQKRVRKRCSKSITKHCRRMPRVLEKEHQEEIRDLFTIIFTSGSTGQPKGVPFTNRHWVATLFEEHAFDSRFRMFHLHDPLALATGRKVLWRCISNAHHIAIYPGGNIDDMIRSFREVRPTGLVFVPRISMAIMSHFHHSWESVLDSLPAEKSIKEAKDEFVEEYGSNFGRRVIFATFGGAKTPQECIELFSKYAMFSIDGCGTTEAGGIFRDGHVDDNVEFRLEDVADMGYTVQDKPYPRGALLVKTPHMIDSYFGDPVLQASAWTEDGFFRTGDVVEKTGDRMIRIIDRVGNLFKIGTGEFVSAEELEGMFSSSACIDQIFVEGKSDHNFLVAVVVPNEHAIRRLLAAGGMHDLEDADWRDICDLPDTRRILQMEIDDVATKKLLAAFKTPRRFTIDTCPFSVENGLLTASGKLARQRLRKNYASEIEEMYSISAKLEDNVIDMVMDVLRLPTSERCDLMQTDFFQAGGDSVTAVELARRVEREMGICIPPEILYTRPSVAEICHYIENKIKHGDGDAEKEEHLSDSQWVMQDLQSFDFDSIYESAMLVQKTLRRSPRKPLDPEEEGEVDLILLTGATGFIGSSILYSLIMHTDVYVTCLVRAKNTEQGLNRVRTAFEDFLMLDPYVALPSFENRVKIVIGDLSRPYFGMTAASFMDLSANVDAVCHCGARVHWSLPYRSLRKENVNSTVEAIRMCVCHDILNPLRSKCALHFVSSVSAGDDEAEMLNLDARGWSVGLNIPSNGYGVSKTVAEYFVRRASAHGVPITIYRPAMVFPHSATGAMRSTDFIPRILHLCCERKAVPDVRMECAGEDMVRTKPAIHGIPVEVVGNVIAFALQHARLLPTNTCMNLAATNAIVYEDFFQWVVNAISRHGIECSILPWNSWKRTTEEPESVLFPVKDRFETPCSLGHRSFGIDRWKSWVQSEEIQCKFEDRIGDRQRWTKEDILPPKPQESWISNAVSFILKK